MDKLLIVDRIEGGVAVCEDEQRAPLGIPLTDLPSGVREGDCLRPNADGTYRIDPDERERRRSANQALFDKLRKK